jgi:predicted ABC-type ATPase
MHELTPIMYVFAGNNGSGKSTIRNLIVDRLGISVNIDPDALARGIDSVHPESRKVSAGKEAIKQAFWRVDRSVRIFSFIRLET